MTEQEWREEFANRLRRIRHNSGIHNQKELADLTGLTEATISQYMKAKRMPDALTVLKLAQVMGCSIDDLLWVDELVI